MIGRATAFLVVVTSAAGHGQSGMTDSQKIASAMAAAPSSISANATIMDWPDKSGKQATLRKGSNSWVCLPSEPATRYLKNNAMCLDRSWQNLIAALRANKQPHLKTVGYAYMLTNDTEEANTKMGDPVPTASNQWHHVGAHIMVAYPNVHTARAVSSDPHNGGPYVMWKDTPYAHVMVPLSK